MNNPYEVLGVSQNATDEEIKAAYRELVKKYHPDKYQGNPLADLAQEKLQEVNEAYDILMKNHGNSNSDNEWGDSSNSSYSTSSSANGGEFYAIRQALDRNDLSGAEQMLVNLPNRSAEWFFLSGVLSFKKGWIDDALANVGQALQMDPGNPEYTRVYQQMMNNGNMYRARSNGQGYNQNNNGCDDCLAFLCCTSCISPCW